MPELLLSIDIPNETGVADDAAVLQVWRDVHALLSEQNAVFVVSGEPTGWFGVSVDATHVVDLLRGELQRHARSPLHVEPEGLYDDLRLKLCITPSGALDSNARFPEDRFIEQLFLACNLAEPGSCAFTSDESVIRLDPELIASACHMGRIPSDDESEPDFWPELKPVSFQAAWEWLHDDLSYDVEVATTPAQIAIFTMLLLASRSALDSDNIVAIARAIEALFGQGVRKHITRTVEERIGREFGHPDAFPEWFREFYDLRSRLAHGATLLRPGPTHIRSHEARQFLDEHLGPLEHGVRLLLASLYKMIRAGTRSLEA